MIVWRITGDNIGWNGNGALFCGTKSEAARELREWKKYRHEQGRDASCDGPDKIALKDKAAVISQINSAMGYGAS